MWELNWQGYGKWTKTSEPTIPPLISAPLSTHLLVRTPTSLWLLRLPHNLSFTTSLQKSFAHCLTLVTSSKLSLTADGTFLPPHYFPRGSISFSGYSLPQLLASKQHMPSRMLLPWPTWSQLVLMWKPSSQILCHLVNLKYTLTSQTPLPYLSPPSPTGVFHNY